jgi:hypothetical protein
MMPLEDQTNPNQTVRKPDERARLRRASRAYSDGTASEIPPTPMTPRGPAPQVVIDTGRPAKLAEKPGQQPKAVDGSRGRDKLIAVERQRLNVHRHQAGGGDVRKVVVKDKGQSRDVGHGDGAVLKKDAKQKDSS